MFRGDARGRLSTWAVPEPSASDFGLLASKDEVPEYMPMETTVMDAEWDRLTRRLPGVIERAVSYRVSKVVPSILMLKQLVPRRHMSRTDLPETQLTQFLDRRNRSMVGCP